MTVPTTRYAKSGHLNIAYQVVGDGGVLFADIVGSTERAAALGITGGGRSSTSIQRSWSASSSAFKDLVAGSGIGFIDRGTHALKGVPGEWQLFGAG